MRLYAFIGDTEEYNRVAVLRDFDFSSLATTEAAYSVSSLSFPEYTGYAFAPPAELGRKILIPNKGAEKDKLLVELNKDTLEFGYFPIEDPYMGTGDETTCAGVAVSPDESLLAIVLTGSYGPSRLRVYSTADNQLVTTGDLSGTSDVTGNIDNFTSTQEWRFDCKFSPDGTKLYIAGWYDAPSQKGLWVFDTTTWVGTPLSNSLGTSADVVYYGCTAFSPDGRYVLNFGTTSSSVSTSGVTFSSVIHVWDHQTQQEVAVNFTRDAVLNDTTDHNLGYVVIDAAPHPTDVNRMVGVATVTEQSIPVQSRVVTLDFTSFPAVHIEDRGAVDIRYTSSGHEVTSFPGISSIPGTSKVLIRNSNGIVIDTASSYQSQAIPVDVLYDGETSWMATYFYVDETYVRPTAQAVSGQEPTEVPDSKYYNGVYFELDESLPIGAYGAKATLHGGERLDILRSSASMALDIEADVDVTIVGDTFTEENVYPIVVAEQMSNASASYSRIYAGGKMPYAVDPYNLIEHDVLRGHISGSPGSNNHFAGIFFVERAGKQYMIAAGSDVNTSEVGAGMSVYNVTDKWFESSPFANEIVHIASASIDPSGGKLYLASAWNSNTIDTGGFSDRPVFEVDITGDDPANWTYQVRASCSIPLHASVEQSIHSDVSPDGAFLAIATRGAVTASGWLFDTSTMASIDVSAVVSASSIYCAVFSPDSAVMYVTENSPSSTSNVQAISTATWTALPAPNMPQGVKYMRRVGNKIYCVGTFSGMVARYYPSTDTYDVPVVAPSVNQSEFFYPSHIDEHPENPDILSITWERSLYTAGGQTKFAVFNWGTGETKTQDDYVDGNSGCYLAEFFPAPVALQSVSSSNVEYAKLYRAYDSAVGAVRLARPNPGRSFDKGAAVVLSLPAERVAARLPTPGDTPGILAVGAGGQVTPVYVAAAFPAVGEPSLPAGGAEGDVGDPGITVGTTAPASPAVGDLWLDTGA